MSRACNVLSRPNALRSAAVLGIIGQNQLFTRGTPASSFDRRQADDDDDTDDDDDDEDVDSDGEDGTESHHSTRTHSSSHSFSTGLSGGLSTSLATGSPTSLTVTTSFQGSLTGGGSISGSNALTSSKTSSTDPTGDTNASDGSNAAISQSEGSLSNGSIAGIVIGSGIVLVIAFYIARCMKRRRGLAKATQLERKDLLGPPLLRSTHPNDSKDPTMTMTSANIASSRPSALYRSASRDSLPQIPFDTPAYTSTDNLASYTYAQLYGRRTSTVLSYDYPSDPTEMTNSTTVRESEGGFGHASLHEDMLRRQKALEAHLDRMHENRSASSQWSHSNVTVNPPPRYQEH